MMPIFSSATHKWPKLRASRLAALSFLVLVACEGESGAGLDPVVEHYARYLLCVDMHSAFYIDEENASVQSSVDRAISACVDEENAYTPHMIEEVELSIGRKMTDHERHRAIERLRANTRKEFVAVDREG